MEVLQLMKNRKSIRSYTGEPVTKEQLDYILDAAYAAPVGAGKYDSVHMTIITNKELLAEIDKNGAEFFGQPDIHPLYGAPMLIVFSINNEGNVGSANVGIILQNMSLAATELGVGHCDIYGATAGLVQNKELTAKLNLPEGFTPTGAIILGQTDEKYEDREIPAERHYVTNTID